MRNLSIFMCLFFMASIQADNHTKAEQEVAKKVPNLLVENVHFFPAAVYAQDFPICHIHRVV